MQGEQLTRQWWILRTIETRKNGATVAELAEQEDCIPRTIWRDQAAIQEAGFPLYPKRWLQEPQLFYRELQVAPARTSNPHVVKLLLL